jgi:hypothetical protein
VWLSVASVFACLGICYAFAAVWEADGLGPGFIALLLKGLLKRRQRVCWEELSVRRLGGYRLSTQSKCGTSQECLSVLLCFGILSPALCPVWGQRSVLVPQGVEQIWISDS